MQKWAPEEEKNLIIYLKNLKPTVLNAEVYSRVKKELYDNNPTRNERSIERKIARFIKAGKLEDKRPLTLKKIQKIKKMESMTCGFKNPQNIFYPPYNKKEKPLQIPKYSLFYNGDEINTHIFETTLDEILGKNQISNQTVNTTNTTSENNKTKNFKI